MGGKGRGGEGREGDGKGRTSPLQILDPPLATVPAGRDFLPETALIRRHASAKATAPKQSLMLVPCCLQYSSAFSVYKPANF